MDIKIEKIMFGLIKAARPVHWVKNLGVFAALVFSGLLTSPEHFMRVFWAFWIFNLAASGTYLLNDVLDVKRDQEHPIKKFRPIASGAVSKEAALLASAVLFTISLVWSHEISQLYFILLILYIVMQIAYSLYLKHLHVIDILIIASGFVIRVYSGAFVIDAHLSVWFLLCVVSVALFLAAGKRRGELGVMGASGKTRKSLSSYSTELLNSYVTMFGNAAWMSWALFTFFESPQAKNPLWVLLAEISKAASINKLLMATIPITIFGIMRYESLIFKGRSEAPEKVLLTDKALVGSIIIWAAVVVWILYGGVSTYAPTI